MTRRKDISGLKSGMLTVIALDKTNERYSRSYWCCLCECGARRSVRMDSLVSGRVRSCGCLQRQWVATGQAFRSHGKTLSREYKSWQSMKARCTNPRNHDFPDYGGRGITVCVEWLNSFSAFYGDMGPAPARGEIERKDNNNGYFKGNCKWATRREQNRNKRSNFTITYNGQTRCLKEWSEILGISYSALHKRLRYASKSVEEAFSKP